MTTAPIGRSEEGSTLTRLRWLTVLAPTVVITVVESTRHLMLDQFLPVWAGPIVVFVSVFAGSFAFSQAVFKVIEGMQREILNRNQELSARNAVGVAVSQALHLEETLGRALETVLEVTHTEAGEILVFEEESKELVAGAHRGLAPEAFGEKTRFRWGEGSPGMVAQSGEPMLVQDVAKDPRFLRKSVAAFGFRSFAAVPLKSKNQVVGVMEVASMDPRRISPQAIELLVAIGNQIGVAIENARLMDQMRYMAILEERDRIGREIHDSFGQTLGYLNMQGRAIEGLILKGKYDEALAGLREMGEGVRGASSDVREAIFSLRTTLDPERDIVSTLRDFFEEFSRSSNISVALEAPQGQEVHLPPGVQVQLLRIVQEALANARKYAQASRATVKIGTPNNKVTLSIEDDGLGFDAGAPMTRGRRSFGLSIMRERAEAVGASFSIHSQPGQGTRVVVELSNGKVG